MLSDIQLYMIGLCATLLVFWSVPSSRSELRQYVLLVSSAAMVLLYSPGGFAACAFLVLAVALFQAIYRKQRGLLLFWLGLAVAVGPLVVLRLTTDQGMIVSFGVAFATVKAIGLMMTAYSGRVHIKPVEAALLIYFFPLFSVGPVERLKTFTAEGLATRFNLQDIVIAAQRVALGLFILYFFCGDVLLPLRDTVLGRNTAAIEAMSWQQAVGLIYVSFLFTYLNFTGFSEIAIGCSRLFGLKIVENFRWPLLAGNVADFWKRYHISMGDWINQFLYFPIAVFLRHPAGHYVAIVVAFVLFGLWHAFTYQYFVWGIGNGTAVALCHFMARNRISSEHWPGGLKHLRVAIWPIAITFVAFLQTFANLASLSDGLLLVSAIVELR